MAQYQAIRAGGVRRLSDGAIIPPDPANLDWIDYLRWIAAGNEADPAPALPAPPGRTYKSDVWRRATDAEAEMLDAMLNQAPVKLRRLWADITILEHESPDFGLVHDPIAAVFGAKRAAELLAPSSP